VVNGWGCGSGSLLPSLQGKGVVLQSKKGAAEVIPRLPLKMGIKKGTVSLYQTLCRKKVRLSLLKWSVFVALEHRPILGKRQDYPTSTEAFLAH